MKTPKDRNHSDSKYIKNITKEQARELNYNMLLRLNTNRIRSMIPTSFKKSREHPIIKLNYNLRNASHNNDPNSNLCSLCLSGRRLCK